MNLGNETTTTMQDPAGEKTSEVMSDVLEFFSESTEIKQPGSAAPTPQAPTTEQPTQEVKRKVSPRASASTAVAMVDTTQRIIFEPIINHKYKKRFQQQGFDSDEFLAIESKDPSKRNSQEQIMMTKFEKLWAKMEKKRGEVPFSKEEREDMTEILETYFRETGQELPPSLMIACAFIGALGKRTTAVIFD